MIRLIVTVITTVISVEAFLTFFYWLSVREIERCCEYAFLMFIGFGSGIALGTSLAMLIREYYEEN